MAEYICPLDREVYPTAARRGSAAQIQQDADSPNAVEGVGQGQEGDDDSCCLDDAPRSANRAALPGDQAQADHHVDAERLHLRPDRAHARYVAPTSLPLMCSFISC